MQIIKTKNKYILFQILNLKENIQSIKIKNYLQKFQYFKAESAILGKTLILVWLTSRPARQAQKINES